MRAEIRQEVESIAPLDDVERETKSDVLDWIDSVVDGEYIPIVDHINAELWLPTRGHVEPNEHPRATVLREAKEELSIDGEFLY